MLAKRLGRCLLVPAVLLTLAMALWPAAMASHLMSGDWNHWLAFVCLTFFAFLSFPELHALQLGGGLVLLGVLIEGLQWATGLGRVAQWSDLLADFGAVTVTLICLLLLRAAFRWIGSILRIL